MSVAPTLSGSRLATFFVAALCTLPLSLGCATKVAGLKADPSFTYDAVMQGKMAVGGVAGYTKIDEATAAQYASLLKTMLQEKRPAYEVGMPGMVQAQMGDENYNALMTAFGSTGSVDAVHAANLASVKAARYVAFCMIESDTVTTDRQVQTDKDKKGNAVRGSEKIVKSATRSITANLSIYDTRSGVRVWSGSVTNAQNSKQTYSPKESNMLLDLVKAANKAEEQSDDDLYPPPTAPTSDVVLNLIFAGFGENMPKE